jgi:hypothetical protein
LPWTNSETNFNARPVFDSFGFEYWGFIEKLNNKEMAFLAIDEFSLSGNPFCGYQMSLNSTSISM